MPTRYLIALGSNMRHCRFGSPDRVLRAALEAIEHDGIVVERASKIVSSLPHGPSLRRYANAAALIVTELQPNELLCHLKRIERRFGRRRGRRWSARVLDLDIVLWDKGAWISPDLTVPHIAFRHRDFVLKPAAEVAAKWRDPLTGLTVRQLARRRYTF